MQIPDLPTDNLYKFVAFSGLVVVIAAMYFMFQGMYQIQNEIFQHEIGMALIDADLKSLEREAERTQSDQTPATDADQRLHEIRRRRAELILRAGHTGTLFRELISLGSIGIVLVIAGGFGIYWGFRRWYALQEMQDKLLMAEYVAKMKETSKSR